MVIQRKTVAQFEGEISDAAAARDGNLDTSIGPVKDLFVTPPASVMKDMHDNTVYLSQLMSMRYAERFNPDDLDAFVFNEGMIRWSGSPAVTTVTFSRLQPPTTDIHIPVNFPLATTANPQTGNVINFRTIESAVMYGPLTVPSSSYYNAATERYEIDVAVASVLAGEASMVGANTIVQFRRAFSSFEYVTNKEATTSGLGRETNSDLAERYLMQVRGNQGSTPAGLSLFGLDNFNNIEDVYVVYGNDVNLTRHTDDAGAVDVWLMAEAPLNDTFDTTYPGLGELIPVPKQPLMSVLTVSSGVTVYTEGTDYEVVTGEGIYAYSDRGQDGIRFILGGTAPALGDPLRIVYNYNSMITIVTSYYTQPEYFVMGSDVLFRWAQPKLVEIEAELKVKSGNPTTVLNLVRERVISYINGLKLGENLEEFDIDAQVAEIFGVDNWVYVTLAEKDGTGVSDIEIGPYEHAFIEDADLVVSLVS